MHEHTHNYHRTLSLVSSEGVPGYIEGTGESLGRENMMSKAENRKVENVFGKCSESHLAKGKQLGSLT